MTSEKLDRQRHLTPLEMGKNTYAQGDDHEKNAHSPTTHSSYISTEESTTELDDGDSV